MRQWAKKLDDFLTVEGLKTNWHILALTGIFILAVWLRYMPESGMAFLQALDPYMIFRMSQHLALEGNLPPLDFMRYFPYAQPVYKVQLGDILFPAIFYWLGPFLFFPSYLEWAQFYPALMGGIGVVFAYLFGKEVWNRTAGISGAFFLATISGVMHRTSAGFFEKEPIGTMFMMAGLYLFVRAWKREEWLAGIGSGLALAGFTLSWGGAKMAWLLYPLTVATVMLLDEDTEGLIRSYTPTVLIGGGAAAALDPARFWFTSSLFLANFGLLGLLWSRKFIEEFELVEDSWLPYYVPGMYSLGLIAAALSPLYSDFVASKIASIVSKVTQSSGATIAGTVAENQPASLSQLVSQLGALPSVRVSPLLGYLSNLVGPWPLAFIAVAFMGTSLGVMVLRKYDVIGEGIDDSSYYYMFGAVLLTWLLTFAVFFQDSVIIAVAPALFIVTAGLIFVYSAYDFGQREVEFRWYYLLPFFWIITNILGAVSKSRLVFLAAFPIAIGAGYTFSLVINKTKQIDFSQLIEGVTSRQARIAALIVLIVPVVLVNAASGYATAHNLGGSPNQPWMQNLEWMEQNTEPGDVVLSWWDYGYWFQSIGRSPAVADGGNAGYYTSNPITNKVNYPIADYFTSTNPDNHTDLFERHSVDYLVLDNTMIGKYSAVSQISNRDNSEFESMITLNSCQDTSRGCIRASLKDAINSNGNRTIGSFKFTTPRSIWKVYTPLSTENSQVSISGAPTLQITDRRTGSQQRVSIDCVLTEEGKKTFNTSRSAQYCIAEDPYYSFERSLNSGLRARAILVPKTIADANLVKLYLMDGYGVDYVEKIPEASNDYVKMWKVEIE